MYSFRTSKNHSHCLMKQFFKCEKKLNRNRLGFKTEIYSDLIVVMMSQFPSLMEQKDYSSVPRMSGNSKTALLRIVLQHQIIFSHRFSRSMFHSIGASFSVIKWLFKNERLETQNTTMFSSYWSNTSGIFCVTQLISRNHIIIKLFLLSLVLFMQIRTVQVQESTNGDTSQMYPCE